MHLPDQKTRKTRGQKLMQSFYITVVLLPQCLNYPQQYRITISPSSRKGWKKKHIEKCILLHECPQKCTLSKNKSERNTEPSNKYLQIQQCSNIFWLPKETKEILCPFSSITKCSLNTFYVAGIMLFTSYSSLPSYSSY